MNTEGPPTMFGPLRRAMIEGGGNLDLVPSRADRLAEVQEELGVSDAMIEKYTPVGPAPGSDVPWIVEDLFLFSLDELVAAQEGYRWRTARGEREALDGWSSAWVVVASALGDPFFVDLDGPDLPVRFARHGEGSWRPVTVASGLDDFIGALAAVERVLLGEYHLDIWDDGGLRADFVHRVTAALGEVVEPDEVRAFLSIFD